MVDRLRTGRLAALFIAGTTAVAGCGAPAPFGHGASSIEKPDFNCAEEPLGTSVYSSYLRPKDGLPLYIEDVSLTPTNNGDAIWNMPLDRKKRLMTVQIINPDGSLSTIKTLGGIVQLDGRGNHLVIGSKDETKTYEVGVQRETIVWDGTLHDEVGTFFEVAETCNS